MKSNKQLIVLVCIIKKYYGGGGDDRIYIPIQINLHRNYALLSFSVKMIKSRIFEVSSCFFFLDELNSMQLVEEVVEEVVVSTSQCTNQCCK